MRVVKSLTANKGLVIDDRGAGRAVVSLRELGADPRMTDPRFRATVERVGAELKSRNSGWHSILIFVIVVVFIGSGLSRLLPGYAFWALYLVLIFGATALGQTVAKRRGAAHAAQSLVAAGLCPGCAYPLSGLVVEEDGCTVCAECGSAWLRSRVVDEAVYAGVSARADSAGPVGRWFDAVLRPRRNQTLVDEMGVTRTVVAPSLRHEIAATDEPAFAERLREASAANIRRGRAMRWVSVAALLAVPGLMLFLVVRMVSMVRAAGGGGVGIAVSSTLVFPSIMCVLYVFFIVRLLRNGTGVSAKAIRREMLSRDLCPSCAGDLRGVAASEVTGLVVCPRCAATWQPVLRFDGVPSR